MIAAVTAGKYVDGTPLYRMEDVLTRSNIAVSRGTLPFVVSDDWTPEQALAVFELLDDLLATITDFYGVQLREQLRELRASRDVRTRKHDPPF